MRSGRLGDRRLGFLSSIFFLRFGRGRGNGEGFLEREVYFFEFLGT